MEKTEPISRSDKRRQEFIEAAYQSIAQRGLWGLRMREVAEKVGLTHATLHYYFPTKENLIKSVITRSLYEGLLLNVPRYSGITPVAKLHELLTALSSRMQEDPANISVLLEVIRHGLNDSAIREIFIQQDIFGEWHENLVSLFVEGIEQGYFRKDLEPETSSSMIMTFLLGLGVASLIPIPGSVDKMITQLEEWVTAGTDHE
jgi:AcrR family transcriptional regulator